MPQALVHEIKFTFPRYFWNITLKIFNVISPVEFLTGAFHLFIKASFLLKILFFPLLVGGVAFHARRIHTAIQAFWRLNSTLLPWFWNHYGIYYSGYFRLLLQYCTVTLKVTKTQSKWSCWKASLMLEVIILRNGQMFLIIFIHISRPAFLNLTAVLYKIGLQLWEFTAGLSLALLAKNSENSSPLSWKVGLGGSTALLLDKVCWTTYIFTCKWHVTCIFLILSSSAFLILYF